MQQHHLFHCHFNFTLLLVSFTPIHLLKVNITIISMHWTSPLSSSICTLCGCLYVYFEIIQQQWNLTNCIYQLHFLSDFSCTVSRFTWTDTNNKLYFNRLLPFMISLQWWHLEYSRLLKYSFDIGYLYIAWLFLLYVRLLYTSNSKQFRGTYNAVLLYYISLTAEVSLPIGILHLNIWWADLTTLFVTISVSINGELSEKHAL